MERIEPGRYQHYKGNYYEVIGIATHSETLKKLVVYRALYRDEQLGENALWVRPLDMFLEKVEFDGEKVSRFKLVDKLE